MNVYLYNGILAAGIALLFYFTRSPWVFLLILLGLSRSENKKSPSDRA